MDHSCEHMNAGLYITPAGNVRFCCVSRERLKHDEINISDITNLQEYFNSERYKSRRAKSFRDVDFCGGCVEREDCGAPSLRHMIKSTYARHGIIPSGKIEHLDIGFSNLCTQQCIMCYSEFSSKWYKFDKEHENTKFKRNPVKYQTWTTEENMLKIFEILPDLKFLSIKGGEPLVQQEVKQLLEYIVSNEIEVKINIVTNFQEISDEMIALVVKLKNLELTVSIDSTGVMYNWIRGGDWNKTMNNVSRFVEYCEHMKPNFGYANTLNRWSMNNLIDDIKIMEEANRIICGGLDIKPWYNILSAFGPFYVSPFILPRKERIDFVHRFEKTFGIIDENIKEYGSLTLNHLDTIIALEGDASDERYGDISASDEWKQKIDRIRG